MPRPRSREERETGQMLVLFALVLVVILAFAALAVDLGVLRNNRQILRNTTDAAALAGGSLMPVKGSVPGAAAAVAKLINSTVQTNYPGLPQSATPLGSRCVVGVDGAIAQCAYTISYRCLIGADSSGPLVSRDIPAACDPRSSLGASNIASHFAGAGDTRISNCNPAAGDKCNVVVVVGSSTTKYAFAPVVGIANGSSGAVSSAACGGPCGAPPPKFNDVELVIDKSGSMGRNYSGPVGNSHNRIYWAGIAAKQLVTDLSNNGGIGAAGHRVGITTFQGEPGSLTAGVSVPSAWTSTAAQLRTTINTLTADAAGNTPTKEGMVAATADLNAHARNAVGGAVRRVLILLSDGRPQPDRGPNGQPAPDPPVPPVPPTNERPTTTDLSNYLGSADVTYSIMIGVAPSPYPYTIGQLAPPGGNLDNNIVDPALMRLLATPDKPAIPPSTEVETYYYNVSDASGLPAVFNQIAGQILGFGARLIQLYPTPVVTSASGPTTAVVISGQYFTGLTSVTVGGTPWPVVTSTDTSITVTHPGGSWTPGESGTKTHVIVTTLGGTSPITPADEYTWP